MKKISIVFDLDQVLLELEEHLKSERNNLYFILRSMEGDDAFNNELVRNLDLVRQFRTKLLMDDLADWTMLSSVFDFLRRPEHEGSLDRFWCVLVLAKEVVPSNPNKKRNAKTLRLYFKAETTQAADNR